MVNRRRTIRPGGLAVVQLTEGTGSVVMQDGTPAVLQAEGTVVCKPASGNLASLAGKTTASMPG